MRPLMTWEDGETASVVEASASGEEVGALEGRVIGDFLLIERIGRGGNGVVYRAQQQTLEREVVIKVLHRLVEAGKNDPLEMRFLREAQLASGLDHPYAAHIYGFGVEPDGLMWIAMELVRGTGMDQLIKMQGALPLGRLVPLLEKICEVVHTAHAQGIVHRDIKPSNIMVLSRAGRLLPKLLDFGIARRTMEGEVGPAPELRDWHLDEGNGNPAGDALPRRMTPSGLLRAATESNSTPRGTSLGSPLYMAPEQWQDASRVDASADQYALGVLTFEALTGQLPFRGSSMKLVAAAHSKLPIPSLGPGFSAEVDAVMQRVLAKNPRDRFEDVLAFARALRTAARLEDDREATLPIAHALIALFTSAAPQPLADSVAALTAATTPHRAARALAQIIRVSFRLLGIVALSANSRLGVRLDAGQPDAAAALDVLRRLRREQVGSRDWLALLWGLVQPFTEQPDVHPIPELVLLFSGPERTSEVASMLESLAAYSDTAVHPDEDTAERARALLPMLDKFLGFISFVCDYQMVVATADQFESWAGARRAVHPACVLGSGYEPREGTVLLIDANNEPLLILSPLIQRMEPAPGTPEELFLFDGAGRHGALMTAFPAGFNRYSSDIWPWLREHSPDTSDARPGSSSGAGAEQETAPYMGLSPFSRADADRFFGREREVEATVNRLRVEPFLAVVGPSGAGKSSFVQAGIASALPDSWHTIVTRPGASPMTALSTCVAQLGRTQDEMRSRMGHDPDMLGAILRARAAARRETIVLVIDQFEELVTLCQDADVQRLYAESLMRATRRADDAVRVIITLRDDFLLRVQQLAPLRERLGRSLVLLSTPPADELERILVEPARRAGYEFDDARLAREMVEAVADEPGALALLSFTASKLWERRDRHFKRLHRRDYQELGGVGGALAQHAESILDSMSDEQKGLVREVFRQLVTAEGTRAILTRRELDELLGGKEQAAPVLEMLISARLLVASESAASVDTVAGRRPPKSDERTPEEREADERAERDLLEDHIEVVHEALLSSWPRLVDWQREDAENVRLRDQLRVAARQWHDRGRAKGLLWRGEALLEYRVWRARYQGAVTRVEDEFAAASIREDARGKRIRRALLVSAFAAMLAVVFVVVHFNRNLGVERDRAEAFAREAAANAAKAESFARASQERLVALQKEQGRQALLAGEPMRAFVYLREALEGIQRMEATDAGDAATGPRKDSAEIPLRFMLGRAVDALSDQQFVIRAQESNVYAVRFSPDGRLIASTGDDGLIKLWDADSGALVRTLQGHAEVGWKLEFNATGTLLASASWDDTAKVWDPRSGELLWTGQHQGNVMDLKFSGNGQILATASRDKSVKVWEANSGRLLRNIDGHESDVTGLAFDVEGEYLASGTRTGDLRIWRIADGAILANLDSQEFITDMAASPDGGYAAGAGENGSIYLIPLRGATRASKIRSLPGHTNAVFSVAFSPDGRLLATAGNDGLAKILDVSTEQVVRTLEAHAGGVARVRFSPDGQTLSSFGFDGTAKTWSLASGALLWTFIGHRDAAWSGDFSPDGDRIVTGGFDGTLRVWHGHKTRHLVAVPPSASDVQHAAFDPSGTMIASAHKDGSVRVWDGRQQLLHTFTMAPRSEFDIMRVVWHPNGTRVLGSGGQAAVEWDVSTGAQTQIFQDQGSRILYASYSPDGTYVASVGEDSKVVLRDAQTGVVRAALVGHEGVVTFMDFDDSGATLVTAALDRTIRLWHVATATELRQLRGYRQEINTVRFSPDGTRLVLALKDKSAELWSVQSGEMVAKLEGHGNEIKDAVFSPDSRLVATASDDRTIKIWDTVLGTPLWSIDLHQDTGRSIEFSLDGRRLLGATGSSVKIWTVGYEQRGLRELDAFARCRIDFALRNERLERVEFDYQACSRDRR